jgi:hypothetical protein
MNRKVYEWNDLAWRETKSDVKTACISLLPDESLRIEQGWEIQGPVRVHFAYSEKDNHTKVRYRNLRKREFDLDNPLEYPCGFCGAERFAPCKGNNLYCTYRVWTTNGGVL